MIRTKSIKFWATFFPGVVAIGLLVTGRRLLGAGPNLEETQILMILIDEMTGAMSIVPLAPPGIYLAFKFRMDRWDRFGLLPLHLLFFLGLATTQSLLMEAFRSVLYPWLLNYSRSVYLVERVIFELPMQMLSYASMLILVYSIDAAQRSRQNKLQNARLESQLLEAKLEVLRLQLNPHFLFNTLNMVSSMMYSNVDRADQMLTRLSDFLRQVLASSGEQQVSLEREMELLEHYISIMDARFGESLEVEFDVDPKARGVEVPCFLLQPLAENAIEQCSENDIEPIQLRVAAQRHGDFLELSVQDNGPGFSGASETAFGKGAGLTVTRDRLIHLYGENQNLQLDNASGGGAMVRIRIPHKRKEEE